MEEEIAMMHQLDRLQKNREIKTERKRQKARETVQRATHRSPRCHGSFMEDEVTMMHQAAEEERQNKKQRQWKRNKERRERDRESESQSKTDGPTCRGSKWKRRSQWCTRPQKKRKKERQRQRDREPEIEGQRDSPARNTPFSTLPLFVMEEEIAMMHQAAEEERERDKETESKETVQHTVLHAATVRYGRGNSDDAPGRDVIDRRHRHALQPHQVCQRERGEGKKS
jgi:hypothetical protein